MNRLLVPDRSGFTKHDARKRPTVGIVNDERDLAILRQRGQSLKFRIWNHVAAGIRWS